MLFLSVGLMIRSGVEHSKQSLVDGWSIGWDLRWGEAGWDVEADLRKAGLVAFVVVASEVRVIWVHRELGLRKATCHNAPCPKNEISGCVGDVFWVFLMYSVELEGGRVHCWDELGGLACFGGHDCVDKPRGWEKGC